MSSRVMLPKQSSKASLNYPAKSPRDLPSHDPAVSHFPKPDQHNEDISQNSPKSQNSFSGFEVRHFLNLLNITGEDSKNIALTPTAKSHMAKSGSFAQFQRLGESFVKPRISSDMLSLSNQKSLEVNSNRNNINTNPVISIRAIKQNGNTPKPLKVPSISLTQSYHKKEASNDMNAVPNPFLSPVFDMCDSARSIDSIDDEGNEGLGPTVVKINPTRFSENGLRHSEVKRSRQTDKEEGGKSQYKDVKGKLSSKNNSAISSSAYFNRSIRDNKSQVYNTEDIKLLNNSKVDGKQQKRTNVANQKRSSFLLPKKPCDIDRHGELSAELIRIDRKEVSEAKTISKLILNRIVKGFENSSSITLSKGGHATADTYNDLLSKKFGGVHKKSNASLLLGSKDEISNKGRPNTSRVDNLSKEKIGPSIRKNMTPTPDLKQKLVHENKDEPSNSSNTKNKNKEVSLTIMNKVPRGVLVKKTEKKNPKKEEIVEQSSAPEREQHKTSNAFDLTKSFHLIKNLAPVLKKSTSREEIRRKGSEHSTSRSKDSLFLHKSPQKKRKDDVKSKSLTSLDGEGLKIVEIKGDMKMNPQQEKPIAISSRPSSVTPADRRTRMSSKSVAVRRENKEFVDLLNKISKKPEICGLIGKEEELIIKDIIKKVQTEEQQLASGHKKENELKVEEQINSEKSLNSLPYLKDCKEERSVCDVTVDNFDDSFGISDIGSKSPSTEKTAIKKSFFLLESEKAKHESDQQAIHSLQKNKETGKMDELPILKEADSPGKEQNIEPNTPILGALSEGIHLVDEHISNVGEGGLLFKLLSENNGKPNQQPEHNQTMQNESFADEGENRLNINVINDEKKMGRDLNTSPDKIVSPNFPMNLVVSSTNPRSEPKNDSPLLTSSILGVTLNNNLVETAPGQINGPSASISTIVSKDSPQEVSATLAHKHESHSPVEKLPSGNDDQQNQNQNRDIIKSGIAGLASLAFKMHPPDASSGTGNGHSLSISTIVNIKKKLKPVYIEKLNPENLKETIYAEKPEIEQSRVSFGDIHDFFEHAPSKPVAPVQTQPVKKEIKSLVMDAKRAQNMSIMVMKFKKLSLKELREAIMALDPEIMTAETCSTLLPFCPLPEEIKACQACTEPVEKLDLASQYMLHIYDVPSMAPRLRANIFKHEFKERLETILENINKIKMGCDVLRANVNFRIFLHLSLEVANILNEGTARGSALGLKPASLLSFDTVRSNKPGLTLLVYMLQKIFEQKSEILDFVEEFSVFNEAVKVNIEDPIRSLQELKNELNQINIQLDLSTKRNPPDTGFFNAFNDFYKNALPLVEDAQQKTTYTKNHYVETAKFLGEDDESLKRKTSIEFFRVFKHLADTVKKFKADEEERRKKEARKAATRK